nr:zinc finger MYM-type protein 1-like [Malus domestica]
MDGLKDRFFSILVDEARDVSVKEQMAMVLRYVDDNGHVIERFVGIQHVTDTTSSSLKDAIDTLFSRNGLSISKLRGQGYDGASNMRALVAIAKKNIDIASFFATANSVVNHVGASCKRRDSLRGQLQEELVIAFENDCLITGRGLNQETSLKRAGDTRWNSHYGTLISIISMFSSVVHVLQMVIDDNPNESAGEAYKLMGVILTFETMPPYRDPRSSVEPSFPDIAQLRKAIANAIQSSLRPPQMTPLETVYNLKLNHFMRNEEHEGTEKWFNHIE